MFPQALRDKPVSQTCRLRCKECQEYSAEMKVLANGLVSALEGWKSALDAQDFSGAGIFKDECSTVTDQMKCLQRANVAHLSWHEQQLVTHSRSRLKLPV